MSTKQRMHQYVPPKDLYTVRTSHPLVCILRWRYWLNVPHLTSACWIELGDRADAAPKTDPAVRSKVSP